MKQYLHLSIIIIFSFILNSCFRSFKIDKEALKYNPYKIKEVLVFESDKNRKDTIFVSNIRKFNPCNDPLALFPKKCEAYSISCKKTDPNHNRYLDEKSLIKIFASTDKKSYLDFNITLKGSWFYSTKIYSLSEFDSIPDSILVIGDVIYNDVKIFNEEEYSLQYKNRNNYALRFFWSKSQGFLGLDRRDEKWRLVKKYMP